MQNNLLPLAMWLFAVMLMKILKFNQMLNVLASNKVKSSVEQQIVIVVISSHECICTSMAIHIVVSLNTFN